MTVKTMLDQPPPVTTSKALPKAGKLRAFASIQTYPDFRYLWASSLLSTMGMLMQTVVLGWLTYDITGSAFLLALFTSARLSPMLLGPIGGVMADRVNRVRLIMALQALVVLTTLALAMLVMTGLIQYWHLLFGGLLLGLGGPLSMPARLSLVTDIVRQEDMSNAMALNVMSFQVTWIVGPGLGGILIRTLGVSNALWITAAIFIMSILSLLPLLKLSQGSNKSAASPMRDLADGFRMVMTNQMMLMVLAVTVSANLLVFPVLMAFMPVFAEDILNVGAIGLGALMAASGAGALVGAFVLASLGDVSWKGKAFVIGTGVSGLCMGFFGLSSSFPLSLVILTATGLGTAGFGVMQNALMMILAPPELRGRAMGILMLAIGITPFATLMHGAVASLIGVPLTTSLAGFLLALNMLAIYIWVPGIRRLR